MPRPALIVLVGASGAGKSAWAGVTTVFVSPPPPDRPEDVVCLTPLAAAFA